MTYTQKRKIAALRRFWRKSRKKILVRGSFVLLVVLLVSFFVFAFNTPNNSLRIKKDNNFVAVSFDRLSKEEQDEFIRLNFGKKVHSDSDTEKSKK